MVPKDHSEDSKNFYLNEQNKKIQKELEEKYGMQGSGVSDDASPEIMNNFLNYVQQFEEQWEKAERKKIREILGNPIFRKIEEIQTECIEDEINIVLNIYAERNYYVDIIEKDDVRPEDFYNFLTQELMEHETDFINVPGMNTNFIYEEFHPNPKLNIKDCTDYFLWGLRKRDKKDLLMWATKENITLNNVNLKGDDFAEKLFELFPDNIEETKLTFKEINVDELKAQIELLLNYRKDDKSRSELYKINLSFKKVDSEYMEVNSLEIVNE